MLKKLSTRGNGTREGIHAIVLEYLHFSLTHPRSKQYNTGDWMPRKGGIENVALRYHRVPDLSSG